MRDVFSDELDADLDSNTSDVAVLRTNIVELLKKFDLHMS